MDVMVSQTDKSALGLFGASPPQHQNSQPAVIMAEEQAAHHLLNVLEERGLDRNLDLDNVLAAFEDEGTKREAAEWVNEYLREETLLTKDELELCVNPICAEICNMLTKMIRYQTLKKKGILHQYEAEEEPVRPILDHELASAIDSLQNSTAAIEAQCQVLEAQKAALMQLKALEKPNLDVEHLRNDRKRKENQEKGRLDVAVSIYVFRSIGDGADGNRSTMWEPSSTSNWPTLGET